ncbi:hypothetical protein FPV67DRAFT_1454818 [Lyophyllum atratum]|nr:hypothetical protein FPV67DRAFT_1454818 [Lyophyllum atratum]
MSYEIWLEGTSSPSDSSQLHTNYQSESPLEQASEDSTTQERDGRRRALTSRPGGSTRARSAAHGSLVVGYTNMRARAHSERPLAFRFLLSCPISQDRNRLHLRETPRHTRLDPGPQIFPTSRRIHPRPPLLPTRPPKLAPVLVTWRAYDVRSMLASSGRREWEVEVWWRTWSEPGHSWMSLRAAVTTAGVRPRDTSACRDSTMPTPWMINAAISVTGVELSRCAIPKKRMRTVECGVFSGFPGYPDKGGEKIRSRSRMCRSWAWSYGDVWVRSSRAGMEERGGVELLPHIPGESCEFGMSSTGLTSPAAARSVVCFGCLPENQGFTVLKPKPGGRDVDGRQTIRATGNGTSLPIGAGGGDERDDVLVYLVLLIAEGQRVMRIGASPGIDNGDQWWWFREQLERGQTRWRKEFDRVRALLRRQPALSLTCRRAVEPGCIYHTAAWEINNTPGRRSVAEARYFGSFSVAFNAVVTGREFLEDFLKRKE